MAFKMKGNPMKRNFGIGSPMNKNGNTGKKELSGFEKAFADAKAAGKKQFTYNGKPYNTLQKGEGGVVDTTKMTGGKPSIGIQGKTGKQKVKMMPKDGVYIKPSQREKMDDKAINQTEVSRVDRGYYD
jgi:hypothetical protein